MDVLEPAAEARRLHRLGWSNAEIARELHTPRGTVGWWLSEARRKGLLDPLPEPISRSCPRCEDPPRSPEPAEAYSYLLGQYLGDGHIVVTKWTSILRIYCTTAYPDIIDECRRAMLAVLALNVHIASKRGCVGVCSYSKHWPCLFPQHGAGRKHERRIVLRPWQRAIVVAHPKPFLRGLIHSDGCRSLNHTTVRGKRYEYLRYFFSNESAEILALCGWALDLIGAEWRYSRYNAISVAKKPSVALLDTFIGPKTLALSPVPLSPRRTPCPSVPSPCAPAPSPCASHHA